jgi:altronate hydrolase
MDMSDLSVGAECGGSDFTSGLAEKIALTAAGEYTKAEKLGHKEYFIPYKYQDKKACQSYNDTIGGVL